MLGLRELQRGREILKGARLGELFGDLHRIGHDPLRETVAGLRRMGFDRVVLFDHRQGRFFLPIQ